MVIIRFVAILLNKLDHDIIRHAKSRTYTKTTEENQGTRGSLPTGHAPQSFDTSINIAFALVQIIASMLNRLSLHI